MVQYKTCSLCGVAYNTRAKHCEELWCIDRVKFEHPDLFPRSISRIEKKAESPIRIKKSTAIPVHRIRWMSARSRANKKGLDFNITEELVEQIINSPCSYCNSSDKLSEIDRMDSSLGYIVGNVTPACRRCNTIKNNVVSFDEMVAIAKILGWNT